MGFKKHTVGDFLFRIKKLVKLEAEKQYSLVTIKLYHRGITKRSDTYGAMIKSSMHQVNKGQFILSGIDARNGAFGIVPLELDNALITNDFWTHEINEAIIDIDYFYWYTLTPQFNRICIEASEGTTNRKRLVSRKFYNFEVVLPDIGQQKIIVSRIKKANDLLLKLKNECALQENYLQLLRQSILQDAIQGKLVPQDPKDEPASELLKRIKTEKEELIKAGKLKKEKPLPPITADEIPFELPKGWVWCRIGDVVHKSEAGKSLICERRQVEESEWGIIKVSAMSWGTFDQEENKVLPADILPDKQYQIRLGDYLISRANTDELIGRSVIVNEISRNLLLSDKSIRFYFSGLIDERYINYYNNGSAAREYYKKVASGTSDSMKNITRSQMYELYIPLPPLSEQRRIVSRLHDLFKTIDLLDSQVINNKNTADSLLQSILKEAFENKKTYPILEEELTIAAEP